MKTKTVIVNSTSDVLKVKAGGHQLNAEVASIDKGGQWDLHVNVNETYREFRLQHPTGTHVVIVSSDDCCDNECITIKEAADGKFEVHRVQRRQHNANARSQPGQPGPPSSPWEPPNSSNKLTWFGWIRQLWAASK